MIISCPSCPQKLRVPEELFGSAVKCPKCGATFEAATPASAGEGSDVPLETKVVDSPSQATASPAGSGERTDVPHFADEPQNRKVRRDAEPSRGTLILTLGILSIVLFVVGWIPGIMAIVMGRTDQKKIRSGQMDRSGADVTQAGWICGIIGTCLNTISCLGCGLYITFFALMFASMGRSGAFNKPQGPGFPKQNAPFAPVPPPGPQLPQK